MMRIVHRIHIVSESDRESEHSDHNTDTEQSAVESDKDVPSTSRVKPAVSPVLVQESLRRSRGRGRRRGRGRGRRRGRGGGATVHHSRSPTRSRSRSSSNEPLARLIDRRSTSAAATTEASSERRLSRVPMYEGKDGTKWLVHPSSRPNIRTRRENIVINSPGVKGEDAKNSRTPLECFRRHRPIHKYTHT